MKTKLLFATMLLMLVFSCGHKEMKTKNLEAQIKTNDYESLIQDKDLHSFILSFTKTISLGKYEEYEKAVLLNDEGKPIINGSKIIEIKNEFNDDDKKELDFLFNEFKSKKYEVKNKSIFDKEDKEVIEQEIGVKNYKNVEEIVQVSFNNGNGFLAILKYNGKWYYISGF